jgi:hypothetical protein
MSRLTEDQIAEIRSRNPVDHLPGVDVRKAGSKLVGPCPVCGGGKRNERFEVVGEGWVCAVCQDGGDVIKLVQLMHNLDFREAVDHLGGVPGLVDHAEAARRAEERARERAQRDAESASYREAERKRMWDLWTNPDARDWRGSEVEHYLVNRVGAPIPTDLRLRLRFFPELPFFDKQKGDARRMLHRGPVMLAPMTDETGTFRGLHMTWLDASQPKGKAVIPDPDEPGEFLPAKKMRGSAAGSEIVLRPVPEPRRVIAAEGIENVLTALIALDATGADLADTKFTAAGSLGNLGGKAVATVRHPTLTKVDARGVHRARMVPGPDPEPGARAMPLPECCEELILIRDGDSEPVLTAHALTRCARRSARPGRTIRLADPGDGLDINDLVKEVAA